MNLYKFEQNRGESTISVDKLDYNFTRLSPLPQDGSARLYSITETPQGWQLVLFVDRLREQILPELPLSGAYILRVINGTLEWASFPSPPTTGTHVLGAQNGNYTWLATQGC